jgi:hypothetical protein
MRKWLAIVVVCSGINGLNVVGALADNTNETATKKVVQPTKVQGKVTYTCICVGAGGISWSVVGPTPIKACSPVNRNGIVVTGVLQKCVSN